VIAKDTRLEEAVDRATEERHAGEAGTKS